MAAREKEEQTSRRQGQVLVADQRTGDERGDEPLRDRPGLGLPHQTQKNRRREEYLERVLHAGENESESIRAEKEQDKDERLEVRTPRGTVSR